MFFEVGFFLIGIPFESQFHTYSVFTAGVVCQVWVCLDFADTPVPSGEGLHLR